MNLRIIIGVLCVVSAQFLKGQSIDTIFNISSDSSINYFKKILIRNKNSAFANYGLAAAYYAKNDFSNAILYSKINLKNKNDFDTACSLIYACSLDRSGKSNEAIEKFEDAIKKYPNNTNLLYQFAFSRYKIREHNKAQTLLKQAISVNPYSAEQHYLLGCSMFEYKNDANCIYPFLYGLMLDNDSARASNVILFIQTYLERKPDKINIPFFESRLSLTSTEEILNFYFPQKAKWQMEQNIQPIELYKSIELFFSSGSLQKDGIYAEFYQKIRDSHQLETYLYYCLRSTKNEYVDLWLKNHSEQLKKFADFLEKNLIGN
jgi:tetratricopeptide (TPR) repeat protein